MSNLLHDVRYGVRTLLRNPGFTAIAVVILALGVGINTVVFTLLHGVALQPLPYHQPARLFSMSLVTIDGEDTDGLSIPDYVDFKEQSAAFDDLGYWIHWSYDVTEGDQPVSIPSVRVSPNMFEILGVEPARGRSFAPDEGQPGSEHVVVVSHGIWQRLYGGDPGLVGRRLELDEETFTVIGIMPEGFRFPYVGEYGSGFWTPYARDPAQASRRSRGLYAVGRLDREARIEQAGGEVETIARRLALEYPDSNEGWTAQVTPLHDAVVGGDVRAALWILYGVVAFVLLIACANLASLLLARLGSRQRELAVRAALGAGRPRLLRQLLTESVLLALSGGALGIVAACWGMDLFITLVPSDLPRIDEVGIDATVLVFALLLSLATGLVFGVLPSYHASSGALFDSLKTAGTSSSSSRRQRFRTALVITEVAIAMVLLVGAGLLTRSFAALVDEELGFDPGGILAFQVAPSAGYPTLYQRLDFYEELLRRIEALPNVRRVGANTAPPLSGTDWTTRFTIAGRPQPAAGDRPSAQFNVTTPDYFRVLDIPLLHGRFFTPDDRRDRDGVVIINEALATRYWPDQDPLGKRIAIDMRYSSGDTYDGPTSYEVIGIVGNVRKFGLARDAEPELFVTYTQQPSYFLRVLAATTGDPLAAVDAVRAQAWAVDPDIPIERITTMEQYLAGSIAQPRFNMILTGGFASLAMLLAVLGIYGVISYSTAERTREFGVRMALGAAPDEVARMMLVRGALLTGAGLAIGLVASLALTRVLAGLLYQVTPTDPVSFGAVTAILAFVALAASYIPARRATKVDPVVALRSE